MTYLVALFVVGCSSSSKKSSTATVLPSEQKQLSVLSKEYPGIFSVADSYVHLPLDEKERDPIISQCQGGKSLEVIQKLFAEMKDAGKIQINFYYIAVCYALNNDHARALHYFGKVYGLSSDVALKSKSMVNMGVIQWKWGKTRKALAYLREAYKIRPSSVSLYLLTNLELQLGLIQKIGERRADLSKYSYTDSEWRFLLAQAAFVTSDYEQSVLKFETLPAPFWENQTEAFSQYLVALYKTGRHQVGKNFMKTWKNQIMTSKTYGQIKIIYPEISKYE